MSTLPETGGYMTEDRRMIQQSARDFAMREVLPVANRLDPEQGDIPMALRDKMAKLRGRAARRRWRSWIWAGTT